MSRYQPGLYNLKVTGQGFGESDKKKTPFFYLQCLPESQIINGYEEPCDQYPAELVWWITDNTVDRVIGELESIGYTGHKFANLDPLSPNYFDFKGQRIVAECYQEHGSGYNADKLYDRWRLPFNGGQARESNSSVAKNLDALFGKKLAKRPAAKAERPAVVAKEEVDVPF